MTQTIMQSKDLIKLISKKTTIPQETTKLIIDTLVSTIRENNDNYIYTTIPNLGLIGIFHKWQAKKVILNRPPKYTRETPLIIDGGYKEIIHFQPNRELYNKYKKLSPLKPKNFASPSQKLHQEEYIYKKKTPKSE